MTSALNICVRVLEFALFNLQSSTPAEGDESKEGTQTGEEASPHASVRSLAPSGPQIDEEALAHLLGLSEANMMAVAALDERLALLQVTQHPGIICSYKYRNAFHDASAGKVLKP